MKKILFGLLFIAVTLFAKVDYSEMSTEELIAMIGYVSSQNVQSLQRELEKRFDGMNEKQKSIYIENLKKSKTTK